MDIFSNPMTKEEASEFAVSLKQNETVQEDIKRLRSEIDDLKAGIAFRKEEIGRLSDTTSLEPDREKLQSFIAYQINREIKRAEPTV